MSISLECSRQRIRSIAILALFWTAQPVAAQTSATTTSPRLTLQGPAEQGQLGVVQDALGRPCLDVEAVARSHVVNTDFIDHVVSIKNSCPRNIDVKVCYFGSDRCVSARIQAYKRVDTLLGSGNKARFFRYSLFQK